MSKIDDANAALATAGDRDTRRTALRMMMDACRGELYAMQCAVTNGTDDAMRAALLDTCIEVDRARAKFSTWPTDPLHAVAVLGEEFGELTKATLQHTYEPHKSDFADVRTEAIQTAAMALRFVASLDQYVFQRESPQHQQ